MRLFSSTKTFVAALFLLLAPLATNALAAHHEKGAETTSVVSSSQANSADKAAAEAHGTHDDHGEKKSFPLGALSFAFVVLAVLVAPAYHRLNVGGDFTGSISSREDTGGH